MTTIPQQYSLGRSQAEYERVRGQALAWDETTDELLGRLGVAPGGRCLDAGCGPGEVMRLLADRVGPTGRVLGIDVDAELAGIALERLHAAGYGQCDIEVRELRGDDGVPGGPFDVVFARLLLFHLADRVDVLTRLWDAVAPGGCLVVQEYDVRVVTSLPELESLGEIRRVILESFEAMGADPAIGSRLPQLLVEAGVGEPDGTDVAGRLDPLSRGQWIAVGTARSLLPVALRAGVVTAEQAERTFAAISDDVAQHPNAAFLWPLLVSAWKHRRPA